MTTAYRTAIHNGLEALQAARQPAGWTVSPGHRQTSLAVTAWATITCVRHHRQEAARAACQIIRQHQNPDGGWPIHPGLPSDIRTALAILALAAAGDSPPGDALRWLHEARGKTGVWGWNPASWTFTEPTALAILALAAADHLTADQCDTARAFLIAAQCAGGGWNSHAPRSLGYAQDATPGVTCWALLAAHALAVPAGTIFLRMGLHYLRRLLESDSAAIYASPYTTALILRTFTLWDFRPALQWELAAALGTTQQQTGLWGDNYLWTAHALIALAAYQGATPTP